MKEQCGPAENGQSFYEKFGELGLHYGPSFRTVQELYVHDSFALAKLRIADPLKGDFGQFLLHPSVVDGALQTIAGLVGGEAERVPHLPFALDEIDIFKPVTQTCWAYAERADSAPGRGGVAKFTIRLLSESGEVLVRFRNLYVRPLAQPLPSRHAAGAA